ncbi:HipA domain-containing protein [Litoribacter populi]|uniref:hypothetical protein n=1 Tax=Litoribacter populi TaxID=2598460 RepID=UPI00117FFCA0|nr:hypothetical protein [Litoribacter populi]
MAQLFEINTWNEQPWWNTGGTRDKKIYQNPEDGELYYFKQSYKKGKMDYKYEFWSEIIAYEVGALCGFDILPYHIAIRNDIVGCISKSMISISGEELIEGGKYLQVVDSAFRPEDTKTRHLYGFHLIAESLTVLKLEKYISNIIEVIVFDALIGNRDRHQENWAIITKHSAFSQSIAEVSDSVENESLDGFPDFVKKIIKFLYTNKEGRLKKEIVQARLMIPKENRFAPIYDSGCCFGRELNDERVALLLKDKQAFNSYVRKSKAEIHWEGEKLNHFFLIEKIAAIDQYQEYVRWPLKRIVEKFDPDKIRKIVFAVDDELQKVAPDKKLPSERKELITKLLISRFQHLNEIYKSLL